MPTSHDAPPQNDTARLEAFSDGVFAVAITLLAFELHVPLQDELAKAGGLTQALLNQWPRYLAYALSFLTILIIWVNHHNLFKQIARTDQVFLLFNGLLLMIVTAIPFATDLLATYIERPDKKVAEIVYSGISLLMALTYNRMWAYAAHGGRLLDAGTDQRLVGSITKQFSFGPPLYLLAFALAFISAQVSLASLIALAVFYALPSGITRVLVPR